MIQILMAECSSSAMGMVVTVVHNIIKMIQIIAPILLIISLVIKFVRLMSNPDNKKLLKSILNSFIAAAVIFFIPMFVDVVMNMVGEKTTLSSCWNSTVNPGISTHYEEISDQEGKKHNFLTDSDEYEKGVVSLPSQVDDSKYNNYQVVASCNSDTLKYKIINVDGNDLVIVWAKNPNMQLNGALAVSNSMGRLSAEDILSNEIRANGYQNKCLVAINASFFSYGDGSPVSGVVINKGNIAKDKGNAAGCIGVDKDNKLIECSFKSAREIINLGVRNTFGISSRAGSDPSGTSANRTQICQIDQNNFVLFSGRDSVGGAANLTKRVTGCSESFNLDGGGSRKLYYKNQSSSTVTKRFGGDRTIPDMLYFVEE